MLLKVRIIRKCGKMIFLRPTAPHLVSSRNLLRRTILAGMIAMPTARPAWAAVPRVAALDWSLVEVALTIGVSPVGATETAGYRRWVDVPVLPGDVSDLGLRVEPNLELLRQLDPGLILTIPDRADVAPLLGRIAPLLSLPIYTDAHRPYEAACAVTRQLADRLGRPQAGEAAIAQAESRIGKARALLRGDWPPVVVIRFVDPRTVFVFGKGGLFDAMLTRLGLVNGWNGPATRWGFNQVSLLALADVAPRSRIFIIGSSLSPEVVSMMQEDPIWRGMPFVRHGQIGRLPPVWFFGATESAARFAVLLAQALVGTADAG
jgi:ferric hydroxamate transport system substrate-binding protein